MLHRRSQLTLKKPFVVPACPHPCLLASITEARQHADEPVLMTSCFVRCGLLQVRADKHSKSPAELAKETAAAAAGGAALSKEGEKEKETRDQVEGRKAARGV